MLFGSTSEFGMGDRQSPVLLGDTVSVEGTAKAGGIVVPDASLLFSGDFKRTGLDLVLSHDDRQFLVRDYFKGEGRATLLAPDGSNLSGQIVNSLTGHVDVAQAGANVSAGTIIGTVVKLTGNATAVRNGVVVALNIGDKVHKGDVVQSGSDSALGISFIDGTAFSLGASARMVLNDMVYDPNGSSNSSLLSLVQGTISFVAGETAKNGNMKIDTPVATMGIRGTAVVVEMTANNGPVKFSIVVEPGGHSGSAVLLDKLTGVEIAEVNKPGSFTLVSATGINQPLSILEVQKTANDLLNERDIIKVAFSIAFPQFNFDDANPKTRFAFGTSGNNLAGDSQLPHPWGGEYAELYLGGRGSFPGLEYGLKFPIEPWPINRVAFSSASGVLVEDSVAQDQVLATSGTLVFQNLNPNNIRTTTFALAHSAVNAALPGFNNDVSQIGSFVVPNGGREVITGINTVSTSVDWNFSLIDSNPVLQSLAAGQTLTEVFTVTVTKNDGSQLTQNVTVSMIGVNDGPILVFSSNDALTGIEDAQEDELSASGTISFRDVDLIDTHSATFVLKSSTSSPHLPGYTDNVSQIGSFALTSGPTGVSEITTDIDNSATVGWSFTLNNNDPVLQSLALGETLTQIYSVIITDNGGAQVSHDVTVTLVGTNDAPIITAQDLIGSVTEQVAPGGNLTDSGIITFTDIDLTDVHLVSATGTPIGSVLGTLIAVKSSDTTGTGSGGQLIWTYAVTDSAVAYLAAGQIKVESFTITFSDQNGSLITRQIDITITGTNDVPGIGGVLAGSVSEDLSAAEGYISTSGALTIADVDQGQSSFTAQASTAGSNGYGSFTLAADGSWTYTASNSQTAIQRLGAGQSLTDSFTAVSSDGSASRLVTVTILGTNDTPVIGGVDIGSVTADVSVVSGQISTSGTLSIADVDQGQSNFTAQSGIVGSNGYGTFTLAANGGWTYTADNSQPAIQQLGANQSLTDSFTAFSSDGSASQLVTVTILGSNNVPVIGGVSAGVLTEDVSVVSNTITTSGALTITDADQGQSSFTAQASVAGTYGTFTLAANGTWTYTASNTQTAVQQLHTGQSISDSFTAFSSDGTASQLVTVTINGTNDTPVIGGVSTGAVAEDVSVVSNNITTGGALTITDADQGQSSFIAQASVAGTYGTFTLAADGAWTYTASNTQTAVQQLQADQSISDSFTAFSSDGTASQLVTVTINGTNDTPVIGGSSAGAVTEDATLTAGGALTIADIDSGQSFFQAPTSLTGTYGTFTFDANTGVWGYTLNNAVAETLPTGQVAHDTLTVTSADGTASQLIDVTITSTNDAPIVQGGIFRVPNITQDNGQLVFDGQYFFADSELTVTDPDGPLVGVAIIGSDDASGQWQYQLAGASEWIPIMLSSGEALLLSANDRVRYKGDAHQDAEVLNFKAWDGSDEFASGEIVSISEVGGSSAFSIGTYTAEAKNANTAPAGIAGEPINLGLADPSWGLDYTATVTISDIPSDWTVNGGIHNLDGSWTVQTTNLESLSVTTPASYSGAYLLNVTASVVLADGSIKALTLGDNVEAYSPGSPIFAWFGDDFLTASSGDDLIVFAQPIGHDVVYSFDVARDQIDLIGYGGFATFADVQAHLGEDAKGNAMITLSEGQSIVLDGIHAASLSKTNFVFDQTPTLHNAGTMTISDGAFMPLSGTIHNTGTIALSSTDDETNLQLIQYGVTLEGGGTILLSDSDFNVISGTSSIVTLDNEDNTISGAGSLGNGELDLANAGTINATGTHALVIDSGSNVVVNSGTLEASGSGGLMVLSAVENSGSLWANGAKLTVQGKVTGTGTATIDGTGILDFEASSTAHVIFGSGTGGTLKLGDAFHFNGTITGFDGADVIDLEDLDSAAASISYQENSTGTGGMLTISDGAVAVALALVGDYSADNFRLAPHQLQGTSITYVAHDLVV